MALDRAEFEETFTEGDARTVKDFMTEIANATLIPYANYVNYTITFDSEDNIIDSLRPRDTFHVSENESRWDKLRQLGGWTGNKMRVENDSELHSFNPVTTGSTFDYEYKLVVSGEHSFSSKELRNRFVAPNNVAVRSFAGDDPQFAFTATSATSFALARKSETLRFRLTSNTEAENIALARIESHELDADVGAVSVPMNVGQEIWDYIKVTDSRQGDSRIGNVRQLTRNVQIPQRGGKLIFNMDIRFGTTVGLTPITLGQESTLVLQVQALVEAYNGLRDDLYGDERGEGGVLGLIESLAIHLDQHHDVFITKNLVAEDTAFMPVEE